MCIGVLLIGRINLFQLSKSHSIFFCAIFSTEEPDAKKAKEDDGEEDYSLADIAEGSVTSVSIFRGELAGVMILKCTNAWKKKWQAIVFFKACSIFQFSFCFRCPSPVHQVGSVDPAKDFRTLLRQKKLAFGDGKLRPLHLFVRSAVAVAFFVPSLFVCGDPRCPSQSVSSWLKGSSSC